MLELIFQNKFNPPEADISEMSYSKAHIPNILKDVQLRDPLSE